MITIRRVDFLDPKDARAFVAMLDAYAGDPMGDGRPLPPDVCERLPRDLGQMGTALAWLAWHEGQPVGVLTAFIGYSTFAARPLVNIHDVSVLAAVRGQGVAGRLLDAVEQFARGMGCVALTMEVRGDNESAKRAYQRRGFSGATTVEPADKMMFWKKRLDDSPAEH